MGPNRFSNLRSSQFGHGGSPSLLVVLGEPSWTWPGPDGPTDDGFDGSLVDDGSADDGFSSDVRHAASLPCASHVQQLRSALTARPTSATSCQPPGAPKR